MKWKRKANIGYKYSEKKTTKTSNKINEYCSYAIIKEKYFSGKNEKSILEPSRGGMGTKLKIANPKFTITIAEVIK